MDPHGNQPVVRAGAPIDRSRGVVILVHGRNASPRNILELVPLFGPADFSYLAPAAANSTWYPYSFLVDRARNEPGLSSGLSKLNDLVDEVVAAGMRKDRIVLAGFSQGACLVSEFALRHPGRYGGVAVYSGGLIGPPGTTWDERGAFDGTPVFLGCSDVDPHIPQKRVEETAAVFTRMGAVVTKRFYPGMGHVINDDEVAFAGTLLNAIAET